MMGVLNAFRFTTIRTHGSVDRQVAQVKLLVKGSCVQRYSLYDSGT